MYLITKVVSGKYADGRINDVFKGLEDLRRAINAIERDIEKNNKDNVLNYSYVFFAEDSDNYDGWFAIESGYTIGNVVIKGKGKVYETIVTSLKNILIKDDHLDHIWNDPEDEDIYICDAGYKIKCDGQNLFGVVSMIEYALSKVCAEDTAYIVSGVTKYQVISYAGDDGNLIAMCESLIDALSECDSEVEYQRDIIEYRENRGPHGEYPQDWRIDIEALDDYGNIVETVKSVIIAPRSPADVED